MGTTEAFLSGFGCIVTKMLAIRPCWTLPEGKLRLHMETWPKVTTVSWSARPHAAALSSCTSRSGTISGVAAQRQWGLSYCRSHFIASAATTLPWGWSRQGNRKSWMWREKRNLVLQQMVWNAIWGKNGSFLWTEYTFVHLCEEATRVLRERVRERQAVRTVLKVKGSSRSRDVQLQQCGRDKLVQQVVMQWKPLCCAEVQ